MPTNCLKTTDRIGYKVVRIDEEGKNHSYVNINRQSVEYIKDKWVGRKKHCGPLALFDSFEAAHDFIFNEYVDGIPNLASRRDFIKKHHRIFECRYIKSTAEQLWSSYVDKRTGERHHCSWPFRMPDGTVYAHRVMLVKECEIHERAE